MEIKCQLDATDDFYCRSYCLLDMFRATLCPSSGAREYYTDDHCLWYLVLWFSSCRYGVELRVMCPVCRLLLYCSIMTYCLLNMFRATLCPSSGAREYYTDDHCLWYLVLWFSSCRYGVELRVMCPLCRLLFYCSKSSAYNWHFISTVTLDYTYH